MVVKSYVASIEIDYAWSTGFSPTAVEEFEEGVTLSDGTRAEPAVLEIIEEGEGSLPSRVRVRLHEGKYHQVTP